MKCAAPYCKRTATHGTLCQQHHSSRNVIPRSRRSQVMHWLVELSLARDLREAARLLDKVVPRPTRTRRINAQPYEGHYDREEAMLVEQYAQRTGDE